MADPCEWCEGKAGCAVCGNDPAVEVRALRAKVRALSGPLPSDPDGRMWSTLNYFANREDDDLDTEVMGWAMSAITGLRTRVAELEAALREAERKLDYADRESNPHDLADWARGALEDVRRALGDGHG